MSYKLDSCIKSWPKWVLKVIEVPSNLFDNCDFCITFLESIQVNQVWKLRKVLLQSIARARDNAPAKRQANRIDEAGPGRREEKCAKCALFGVCEWELHRLKRWTLCKAEELMQGAERREPHRQLFTQLSVCATKKLSWLQTCTLKFANVSKIWTKCWPSFVYVCEISWNVAKFA